MKPGYRISASELAPSVEDEHTLRRSIAAPVAAVAAAAAVPAAVAARPVNAWDKWEQEVETLVDRGAMSEALRRAAEAVEKYPKSARLEEFRAGLLEKAGRVEEAAKSYVAAYKKAQESGATERAKQVLDRASNLARRSGPLMLEVGTALAALGATGVAVTLLMGAADYYRRNGERKRLVQILDLLRRVSGTNPSAIEEMQRLEREVGSAVHEVRSMAPQVRAVTGELQSRSAPPRAPVAPRIAETAPRQSTPARGAGPRGPITKGKKPVEKEGGGGSLFGVSILVLGFTLISGMSFPSLIGGIFTVFSLLTPTETSSGTGKRVMAVMALSVFILAFLISLRR